MKIMGLQKLTLLDFPGKMACTVFTAGCNFRCPFCHNALLVTEISDEPVMSEEEFFQFLEKRKGILEGVCITGGEPTLQPDIENFIRKIKELGFAVKLDTNGYKPETLISLAKNNLLDYVAMDIKSSKEKYAQAVGLSNIDLDKIKESINFLLNGNLDFEFRTTVVKQLHDEKTILDIARWIKGAKKYYLQDFKDSGNTIQKGMHGYDKNEMKNLLNTLKTEIPTAEIRGL